MPFEIPNAPEQMPRQPTRIELLRMRQGIIPRDSVRYVQWANGLVNAGPGITREVAREQLGQGSIQRIQSAIKAAAARITPEGGLLTRVNAAQFPDAIQQEVEDVLNALLEDGPGDVGDRVPSSARFLRQFGDNENSYYGVDGGAVRDAVSRMEVIQRTSSPQQRTALQQVINELMTFQQTIDGGFALAQAVYNELRRNSTVNRAFTAFARVLGTAVGTLGAGVTLPMGSPYSLLYAGLALFSSGIPIFEGAADRVTREAATVVRSRAFISLSRRHQPMLEGAHGRAIAANIYENLREIDRFLRTSGTATDEDRDEIVRMVAGDNPARVKWVRSIVATTDFRQLVTSLSEASDADARESVMVYMQNGDWRRDIRAFRAGFLA
jgi:hypothetical protein